MSQGGKGKVRQGAEEIEKQYGDTQEEVEKDKP